MARCALTTRQIRKPYGSNHCPVDAGVWLAYGCAKAIASCHADYYYYYCYYYCYHIIIYYYYYYYYYDYYYYYYYYPQVKNCLDRKIACLELLHEGTIECDCVASPNGYKYLLERVACLLWVASRLFLCISVRPVARTLRRHCQRFQTTRLQRARSGECWRLRSIWLSCMSLLHWLLISLQMK